MTSSVLRHSVVSLHHHPLNPGFQIGDVTLYFGSKSYIEHVQNGSWAQVCNAVQNAFAARNLTDIVGLSAKNYNMSLCTAVVCGYESPNTQTEQVVITFSDSTPNVSLSGLGAHQTKKAIINAFNKAMEENALFVLSNYVEEVVMVNPQKVISILVGSVNSPTFN